MCESMSPTVPENMEWGMNGEAAPAPGRKVGGPGRANRAAYHGTNILAAPEEQRPNSTWPQPCFKTMFWVQVGGHLASSSITGSPKLAPGESW